MPRTESKKHKLRQVLRGLARMYGPVAPLKPRKGAGLDTLIEAMLSQNTNMANADSGF